MQFIGIEIDPNGTHALVLDLDSAKTLTEALAPHSWIKGLPTGYCEQEPTHWIEAADKAVRECLSREKGDKNQIVAIAVAGPQRGLVMLDDQNRVVRPTKLAGDLSVRKQTKEISRAFGGSPCLLKMIGQSPAIDSIAAECLWLKQHQPYQFQRAAAMLAVQDFITYWITGERAAEPGSASTIGLFDIRERKWSSEIIDFIDPDLSGLLPPIGASDQPRGLLRKSPAKQWSLSELVQVGAGSAAPLLSTLAAGCVNSGSVAIELGSSGTVIGVGSQSVNDLRDEISPLCSATGSWIGMACSRNTSFAPQVLKRHCGRTSAQYEQIVSSVSLGADQLLLLQCFAAEMRLLGHRAESPLMLQLLADALGTAFVPVSSRQGAAVGAAMQAAVAFFQNCGESLGFTEIGSYLVSGNTSERCEPDPTNHELYLDLMSRQQYLVDTLHPAGFL